MQIYRRRATCFSIRFDRHQRDVPYQFTGTAHSRASGSVLRVARKNYPQTTLLTKAAQPAGPCLDFIRLK
ncbi:hypothetical protein ZHAS_00010400 [Anopheles sinensis]|uniref:Uncharacterized protein n=1 Tax=Anopheles sinensis TaxID=74873 RepID=A0A084VXH3_ANOSI|nr:hypothetical protein ZHAS_00010400 [Anopheles sinensis]